MSRRRTVSDIGEFGLIEGIKKLAEAHGSNAANARKGIIAGIGDDAAALNLKHIGDRVILFTTDTLAEGVHFRRGWMLPEEIGRKAVEANASDIAAMGGKPLYALVSLAAPSSLEKNVFDGIFRGIVFASEQYKTKIIGGNISRGKEIQITLTLIGAAKKDELCLRSGAKPGDFIFVSRPLGASAAGLGLFSRGIRGFEETKKKFRNPKADFSFSGRLLAAVTSMIDISDGLLGDLGHVCESSKAGATLFTGNIPIDPDALKAAHRLNHDPLDYALHSGEEYALLYTLPEQHLPLAKGFLIGEITRKKGIYLFNNGVRMAVKPKGFDHFLRGKHKGGCHGIVY
ncbi:thiamine-phosphate kinase [Candidatus Woesearchaeota archaeon]|nr:thiamine-phosphate kinase [Candidatus Woesearchaeota archaeon]